MNNFDDPDVPLVELLELLLEAAKSNKVQVVALPALLEDVIHEIKFLEQRLDAYRQSILWYGGCSSDKSPMISVTSLIEKESDDD